MKTLILMLVVIIFSLSFCNKEEKQCDRDVRRMYYAYDCEQYVNPAMVAMCKRERTVAIERYKRECGCD